VIKRIHGNAAGTAFARIITAANVADRTGYVARHGDLGSVLIQLDTVEVFQVTSVTPTVLTPTNAVANHALTHQFGGSDLILAQLLGSLGAAGFVMETDGAGGWTLMWRQFPLPFLVGSPRLRSGKIWGALLRWPRALSMVPSSPTRPRSCWSVSEAPESIRSTPEWCLCLSRPTRISLASGSAPLPSSFPPLHRAYKIFFPLLLAPPS